MHMTVGKFAIPTINRCDINRFHSAASKSMKQEDGSSSPAFVDVGDAIAKVFEKYQAIYLPQYFYDSNDKIKSKNGKDDKIFRWKDLSDIFENLNDSDKESFCIENETSSESFAKDGDETGIGSSFLKAKNSDNRTGYCSFMIQNDKEALSSLLNTLPVKDPVTATSKPDRDASSDQGWGYEPCLWIFFGRNNSVDGKDLDGRPEHTDQISHDGTWHYQLSGTKRWLLRPTPQLLRSWKHDTNAIAQNREDNQANRDESTNENRAEKETEIEPEQMSINCRQGDVLIVNTRLWRHQTILPPQNEPSVSYARDFWINKDKMEINKGDAGAEKGAMTNVDGLYAMDDVEEDTVIFREDDMPDCEMHRSSEADKANCKIVELEDGLHAVVSSKFIRAGDFFCIPESSDEEEEDSDGEGEEGWLEAEAEAAQ